MRPHKPRSVKCDTKERCFGPLKNGSSSKDTILLRVDELEAIRLSYVEDLKQEDAAQCMNISRSTLSRILSSANRKIGKALVDVNPIKVEGGCCKFSRRK